MSKLIDSSYNDSPLVSVVIANFNYGRFLSTAIESVFSQTYQNIELIVVDDGSTDESWEIIQSYKDRLIPISQLNSGPVAAYTLAINNSNGEIICFLDADDYFHPEKVACVVSAFQEHPDWLQVGHTWLTVDSEGRTLGRSTSDVLNSGDVLKLLMTWGKYASSITSAMACRRSALDKVMPFKPGRGMDTYLNMTMPFYGPVGGISKPLMFYRIHGNNKRAHSNDLNYLIDQRISSAEFINSSARELGHREQFDIQNDPDYLSYEIMQSGAAPLSTRWRVIKLSIKESKALKRSLRDTFIRLIYRGVGAFFPAQGKVVMKYGFRKYLKLMSSKVIPFMTS